MAQPLTISNKFRFFFADLKQINMISLIKFYNNYDGWLILLQGSLRNEMLFIFSYFFLFLTVTKQILRFSSSRRNLLLFVQNFFLYLMRIFYYYKKILITNKPHKCRIKNICSSKNHMKVRLLWEPIVGRCMASLMLTKKPNNFFCETVFLFMCFSVFCLTTIITTKKQS